jgi:hypothetical protein
MIAMQTDLDNDGDDNEEMLRMKLTIYMTMMGLAEERNKVPDILAQDTISPLGY